MTSEDFAPNDSVIWTSPLTGLDVKASYRGEQDGKAVIFTGTLQATVEYRHLRKEVAEVPTVEPSPGPWHVRPDYGQENVYRLWDAVDNYHDDTSPEVMDVNARIMEASRDMLEALRLASINLALHAKRGLGGGYAQLAQEAIDAAIAKAEGKE